MSTTESIESIEVEAISIEVVLASLKTFATADLFKVSKASLAEAEKRVKSGKLEPKVEKEKKPTPKQLLKPKEWVNWVLHYSHSHGWELFTVENKKAGEIIEMPASVKNEENGHFFPNGKKMTLTLAMSLSKMYWAPKNKVGSRKDLYDLFENDYSRLIASENEKPIVAATESKTKMIRKTAEEKALEKEEAARVKEQQKIAKREKKLAEKMEKTSLPKAAIKISDSSKSTKNSTGISPVKTKAKNKTEETEWTCPNDGQVYPWRYKNASLLRNYENQIWTKEVDGSCGDWMGVYLPEDDIIDDSAADPFADE